MRRLVLAALLAGLPAPAASDPIRVVSVDVTPLLSPGPSNAGPQNTMGQALLALDTGGLFDVTELTPAEFRVLTVSQISSFDLLAVNNHPGRLDDGSGLGLGTTWHQAVGVQSGGRVLLSSHDAPRFHMNQTPPAFSLFPGPGEAPFGAGDLVRQAALWAGGVPGQTGLLIFNDAPPFVGGQGWDNAALDLPAAWGITDLDP